MDFSPIYDSASFKSVILELKIEGDKFMLKRVFKTIYMTNMGAESLMNHWSEREPTKEVEYYLAE